MTIGLVQVDVLVWADNIIVCSQDVGKLKDMMAAITRAFYRQGMFWKPKSWKHVCSNSLAGKELSWTFNGEHFFSEELPAMEMLGVMLDNSASTDTMLSHRMQAADRHFASKLHVFKQQHAVHRRVLVETFTGQL